MIDEPLVPLPDRGRVFRAGRRVRLADADPSGRLRLDSCACLSCGARWDEDADSGQFRGRASRSSILAPRDR